MRFRDFVAKDPEAPAVIDGRGKSWTRGQVAQRADGLANALRANGQGIESVMAIIAKNDLDFIVAYLAATQIGMYVVPINWRLSAGEIQYILRDSGTAVVVVDSEFVDTIFGTAYQSTPACQIRISVGGKKPGFTELSEYIADHCTIGVIAPVQGRVLSYTSATTGMPKGVRLPMTEADRALDLSITLRVNAGTLPEDHVHLCAAMLFHGAPLEGAVVSLHMGHVIVLMDRLDAEEILKSVDAFNVTMAYIVPSMFSKLLRVSLDVRNKYSLSTLRKVLHAGAPCPINLKRQMIDWWGPIFWEAYGATEGAGTIASSEDWLRYPGTVGRPMSGTRLRILDSDGNELPANNIGLVYLTRYSGDRFEYLNDIERTSAVHRGDFFTVGDIGYLNQEGFLFLCDRATDVINRSGIKIYPAELEGILAAHPLVADCAVFGAPDERFGEEIVAVIQPSNPSARLADIRRELVRFLSDRVSLFKVPQRFHLATTMPRDASGKLQRRRLREQISKLEVRGNSLPKSS